MLTQSLDIAIAGGEVLDSRGTARDHIVKRSFDIIQPDVTLCGGIAEVLFIAEMARLWSVQCVPHCWAGAIAIAATLQVLSLLPPYTWGLTSDEPMLEFDVYENPFRDEIVTKPFELKNGHVEVPTGPGLGIEVNEEAVKKYLVKKYSIRGVFNTIRFFPAPRARIAAVLVVCWAGVSLVALAADEPATLVLRGGAVFDPVAGVLLPERTIVIEGSHIRAVTGPGDNGKLPPGARVIDCRGKFIIPGLIDAHVHLVHLADLSHVAGDQFLPMFLAAGVTSVRDTGDSIVGEAVIARYAELRPELCPRVFLCSPLIDRDPPFHGCTGYAITDPAKVKPFVKDMAGWNVTTLKIYVGTPAGIGRQVIKEGHLPGMKVTAHLGAYSAQDAVADGIDCLEHIESVFNYVIPPDVMKQPGHRASLDLHNPLADSLIAELAQRRVNVDPTLVVFRNMLQLNDIAEVNQHRDLARVPRRMLDYWRHVPRTSALPPATLESRKRLIRKYQELTGLLHKGGVRLLCGTDAPEPYVPPGFSLHQELEMLVESGLTPAAALAAATINGAEALHQKEQLGTIEPGKLADLVILTADPTRDIRNTRKIQSVIRSGMVCDPETVLQAVPTE